MQYAQTLQKALLHHQAGRVAKAETMYRAMLRQNATDGQLLHLLAIAADQQGRTDEALSVLQNAVGPTCPPDNLKTWAQFLKKAERFDEAEPAYRRAVAAFPNDVALRCDLGEVYRNLNRPQDQVAQFRSVIALNPDHADAYNNLAVGLSEIGDIEGAIVALKKAAEINNSAMTWNNLGLLFYRQDQWDEALVYFRKAVEVDPTFAQAHNNIAVTLAKQGKTEDAFNECKLAIEADPDCVEAHKNFIAGAMLLQRPFDCMGSCLKLIALMPDAAIGYTKLALSLNDQGQYADAVTAAYKAIQLDPEDFDAYQGAILALSKLGRYDESLSASAKLLVLRPESAAALCTVGLALAEASRFDDALAMCGKAIALEPDNFLFHHSIGCISHAAGLYEASITMCNKVLEMKPDYILARWDRSLMYLMTGDFKRGWSEFEVRWETSQMRYDERKFDGPRWRGEDLRGKTILLTAEQGLGDTIQFSRYAILLAERGARVAMYIQAPLKKLIGSLKNVSDIYTYGETPGPFDYQCPMMSLPLLFGTDIDTVPFRQSYLSVDDEAHAKWEKRVARSTPGLKVGLVWAGNPKHRNNRRRSMKLEQLKSLFDLEHVHWFSLQVGPGEEQLQDLPPGLVNDLRPDLHDFVDTAAAISALDLVISVDTSTVHLAAALGKPTWIMVPHVPDWRWLTERRDSPWYESVLIFRQPDHGDWGSVVEELTAMLKGVIAADRIAG